jgi:hypothetical protein
MLQNRIRAELRFCRFSMRIMIFHYAAPAARADWDCQLGQPRCPDGGKSPQFALYTRRVLFQTRSVATVQNFERRIVQNIERIDPGVPCPVLVEARQRIGALPLL